MYVLYDVLSDYSLEPVPGKHQFGDLEHAKKRAVKDNRGRKIIWRVDTKWKGGKAWKGANEHEELINLIVEHESRPKRNPRKKTMAQKKKRTAKQLANDKRLGRMAKARAKKKRRVNPKRKKSAKSHLWLVFKCHGRAVHWASALGFSSKKRRWSKSKGEAVLFKTKNVAQRTAALISKERGMSRYYIGVANAETSAATIAAHCAGKT